MKIDITYDEEVVEVVVNDELHIFEPLMSTGSIVDTVCGILDNIPNVIVNVTDPGDEV